jgi:hypothetical protein
VKPPFSRAVGAPADEQHADDRDEVRDGRDQADPEIALHAERLDDRRQPERDSIEADHEREVDRAQRPDLAALERVAEVHLALVLLLRLEVLRQDVLLLRREPLRVQDAAVKIEEHPEADEDRRDAFEQEQPLPAREARRTAQRVHDGARNRIPENAGDGDRGDEERGPRRAEPRGIPEREVEDDSREEPRFGDAEQEAHDVEHPLAVNEHHRRRDDAPRDHDPGDPDPRAKLLEEDVARHLEEKVADEEDPGAKGEGGITEREVLDHLQLREAHVHPVQVGQDVAEEQEGNEPPVDLRVGFGFEG